MLKKFNIELPYDTAVALVGIHPKTESRDSGTCTPMFTEAYSQ